MQIAGGKSGASKPIAKALKPEAEAPDASDLTSRVSHPASRLFAGATKLNPIVSNLALGAYILILRAYNLATRVTDLALGAPNLALRISDMTPKTFNRSQR